MPLRQGASHADVATRGVQTKGAGKADHVGELAAAIYMLEVETMGGWMYRVGVYLRVQRAVMVEGMSVREASREFGLHRDTVRKMLAFVGASESSAILH